MRREQQHNTKNPPPWFVPADQKIRGRDAERCDYCDNIWIADVRSVNIKHHLRCPDRIWSKLPLTRSGSGSGSVA